MRQLTRHDFFLSLPQPLFILGCVILTASSYTYGWISPSLVLAVMILLPVPMLLVLERLLPKRKEWLLNWKDLASDFFWLFGTYIIWLPLYATYYDAPMSDVFRALSLWVDFPYKLQAYSVVGTLIMALIGILAIEFIGYWVHRLQHRFMFLWRMHATHHHVTKMSVARTDRTHPLEFIGLNLGSIIVLAFMGASANVVAVILVFRMISTHINHANLPLTSGIYGWLFTTPEMHRVHHSIDYDESNSNFGCTVIFWDRLFGTFSSKENIVVVGNGTGKSLSLWTQLSLPFYSNKAIRKL
ncbi:sterol desaturase family protein [Paraglaciecola marina]|uniref:sterol desaturase family protein n=1 Tax=Paraglaciecola marina TaxID=2500157 RepID=UPI0010619A88|nr:sterol desaturase family protein [Paraglaciecola marina]